MKKSNLPSAHAPGALSVTDGTEFVGTIVKHSGEYFSFDPTGVLVGEYPTQAAAMRSLPRASS
jgi:hypothetical protein